MSNNPTDHNYDPTQSVFRIFSNLPIENKLVEDHFVKCSQQKLTTTEGVKVMMGGRYRHIIKSLSQAFPDHEFSGLHATRRSLDQIHIEKWKAGEMISHSFEHTYNSHPICKQFEAVFENFGDKHLEYARKNGHYTRGLYGEIINKHEHDCPCQFCSARGAILDSIDEIVNEIIDKKVKPDNLIEITKFVPDQKTWMINLLLACQ